MSIWIYGLKMWDVWWIKSKFFLRDPVSFGCNDRREIDSLELINIISRYQIYYIILY